MMTLWVVAILGRVLLCPGRVELVVCFNTSPVCFATSLAITRSFEEPTTLSPALHV